MFNPGFGQAGVGQSAQMQALAQQYWSAWAEAMRHAGGQPPASMPGAHAWGDALNAWSQFAHGGRSDADQALARFNQQARHWFAQMQQLAGQFAGQSPGARQIVDAWRKALGAASENPFPEMFRAMGANAMPGLGQWVEDASPYLDSLRREMNAMLSLPAFGLAREHQERLQALARAQLDYQERSAAFNALLAKSGQRAFELFEDKLGEREELGRQLGSARALFDLWVDAAEEAYAEAALTPEFREVYGALVNAQMRLRQGVQTEIELACAQFGMPTRTEMDSAHRKIAELQRELRRLRQAQVDPRTEDATDTHRTSASGVRADTVTADQASSAKRPAPGAAASGRAGKATRAAARHATGNTAKKTARTTGAAKAGKGVTATSAQAAVPSTKKASASKTAKAAGTAVKPSAKKAAAKTAARTQRKPASGKTDKTGKRPAGKGARKAAQGLLAGIPMPAAPVVDGKNKGGR